MLFVTFYAFSFSWISLCSYFVLPFSLCNILHKAACVGVIETLCFCLYVYKCVHKHLADICSIIWTLYTFCDIQVNMGYVQVTFKAQDGTWEHCNYRFQTPKASTDEWMELMSACLRPHLFHFQCWRNCLPNCAYGWNFIRIIKGMTWWQCFL